MPIQLDNVSTSISSISERYRAHYAGYSPTTQEWARTAAIAKVANLETLFDDASLGIACTEPDCICESTMSRDPWWRCRKVDRLSRNENRVGQFTSRDRGSH